MSHTPKESSLTEPAHSPMTSNNKKNKKGNIKNYHKNCSHYLLAKMGSYGLWSNTLRISWGAFPQDLGVCLCNIYGHSSPYPLTLKPKKTRKSKTGKVTGVVEVFWWLSFEGEQIITTMDEGGQASTNCYFTRNITLQQLKHHLLIPFKKSCLSFFVHGPSHLPLRISSSFSCYFSQQKQRKETHNKLQFKDVLMKHKKEATVTEKVVLRCQNGKD